MKSASIILIALVLVGVPLGVFVVARRSHAAPTLADPNTTIVVGVSIGGVRPGEARVEVERLLGAGLVASTQVHQRSGRGPVTVTTVRYRSSRLVVVYAQSATVSPYALAVATTSPRYRTSDGLRVGSSLEAARKTTGISCSAQPTGFACDGGLGFEKPVTTFVVQHNRAWSRSSSEPETRVLRCSPAKPRWASLILTVLVLVGVPVGVVIIARDTAPPHHISRLAVVAVQLRANLERQGIIDLHCDWTGYRDGRAKVSCSGTTSSLGARKGRGRRPGRVGHCGCAA